MNREQVSVTGLVILAAVGLLLAGTMGGSVGIQPIVAVTALVVMFCLPDLNQMRHWIALSAIGALYIAYGSSPFIAGMAKSDTGFMGGAALVYVLAAAIIFFMLYILTELAPNRTSPDETSEN